jgi:hypothetical protein
MPPIKKSVLRLQNLRTKSSSDENRERERGRDRRIWEDAIQIIANIKKFFDSVKSCDLVIDPKRVVSNTAICADVSEKTVRNVRRNSRNPLSSTWRTKAAVLAVAAMRINLGFKLFQGKTFNQNSLLLLLYMYYSLCPHIIVLYPRC